VQFQSRSPTHPDRPACVCTIAERIGTLPDAPGSASARLSLAMRECDKHGWSDQTRAALARGYTDWLAIAHWLGRSIDELLHMDATDLLVLLRAIQASICHTEPDRGSDMFKTVTGYSSRPLPDVAT